MHRDILQVIQGDITKVEVDAIVNAANTSLLGGGGVDGAIHRAGGSAILEACIKIRNKQGGCNVGEAVITTAGYLPANFVIHTNSLKLAVDNHVQTIAFPNISTGIYRFPKERAAAIAIRTVSDFINNYSFTRIVFVCFDDENYQLYNNILKSGA
jgi:O-acetyl-ADP-ribose deacetylase